MKIYIFLLFCLLIPSGVFAIDPKIETAYENLANRVDRKYSQDMQQIIFADLANKLENLSERTSTSSILPLIDDLQMLNNEKLYKLWLEWELSISTQKVQELREVAVFKSELPERDIPQYIQWIIWWDIQYIHTDDSREYFDGTDIKRIQYSSYVPIDESNASRLKNKSGIIIYDTSTWYRFVADYSLERKIPYSELAGKFNSFLTENHRVTEKNGKYYAYNFINFRYFEDKYGAYPSSLETSWFDYSNTLLYKRSDWGYNFVSDYTQYPIADSNLVFWVPEKHLMLDYLREDAKFESIDMNSQLEWIKALSKSLTQWKTRQESIQSIYAWILNNVEYTRVINLSDEKIFSWIETFIAWEWVCTWYTKLSSYLFYFAGYHDVEVIRWHVIDAQDFPEIWHAWLKIWELYYDPTFDDPIWAENTKNPSDYKYFWLPKDIFYANRYEYDDLPEYLNTASKDEIHNHIFNKLTSLIPKYQGSLDEYPVFWEIVFRNKYNLSATTDISPELLASKIWSYTVENNSFKYIDDSGTQKQVIWFRYYPLGSDSVSAVLDLFWYDTSELTLFYWQKESWDYEWRLAYEIETR